MEDITVFMMGQYNPKHFFVRKRFHFWSDKGKKPGENIQEVLARLHHDIATSDFSSIRDPQDETLRTQFISSVNIEAVLNAPSKIDDGKLTFAVVFRLFWK